MFQKIKTSLGDWVHFQGKQVLFLFLAPTSIGVNSKRREFAPLGANSFLQGQTPLAEGFVS